MKKEWVFLFFIFCFGNAQEDFIDDLEYGKRLYENPRGISCQKCHGTKGEGRIIAQYKVKGKEKKLIAPSIRELDWEKFAKQINQGKGVMPKYYLTSKEILAIYQYLKNQPQKP